MKTPARLLIRVVTILCLWTGLSLHSLYAQMRVGQPAGSPDPSAALDVSGGPYSSGSAYRGLLPPKVALTQTTQAAPVTAPATGLLVYNTAKVGDVTPGYYYWEGSKWARFNTTSNAGSARIATAGGGQFIKAFLLADLSTSAFTSPYPDHFILVDSGKEGLFRFDATDTSTPDNGGTVLVRGGKCYKRKFSGPIDVRWFGAKGDEIADDTAPFQSAIDAASLSGVKHVIVPWGHYNITNTVTVKAGVTLQGQPKIPFKAAYNIDFALIMAKTAQGDTTKSVFMLEKAAGMKGFSFYWPDQSKLSSAPIKYGWAITTAGIPSSADNIIVEDIMLTNCYLGINMDFGGQWNIRNIFGQTFSIGIRVDRMFDASRIENIHFWDFWTKESEPAKQYIQHNGRALVIGRADGLQCNNIFAWGHKNVLHFFKAIHSDTTHSGAVWGQFTNVTADACSQPIFIESADILQLSNVNGTNNDSRTGHSFVETGTNVGGDVSITNLYAYKPQTVINIKSKTGTFKLTNIAGRKRNDINLDVMQYKVINQSTAKVILDEGDYTDVSGSVQIGSMSVYSSDSDITASITDFTLPDRWPLAVTSRISSIPGGSSFDLHGSIQAIRQTLPATMVGKPNIYIVECDIQQRNPENLLYDGQFYLRLTDGGINDLILPGNYIRGFFAEKTHLKVPFIVRGGTAVYLDFVFGNNSNQNTCKLELTNLKLYQMDNNKVTQSHLDWLHMKQPNSLNLSGPIKGQRGYVNINGPTTIDPSQTEYVSVVVGSGVTNTVTLSTMNWPKGKILWVSRYDSNQTGVLTVAVSSGQIQNANLSFIGSNFTYPSGLGSAGFIFDGINTHCISF